MQFAAAHWFFLLIPLLWLEYRQHKATEASFRMSGKPPATHNWRTRFRPFLRWLRPLALLFLIIALARPQRLWQEEKVKADALDIMLALDISPSMLSKDFDPDRLSVAKKVATDFVEKRPYDRLGLVAFSAEAFTQCPLTTDKNIVKDFIRELTVGRLEDGTAIGMGLATALNRLKDSPSRSKLVILLTDGENNAGYISPIQAAGLAHSLGIRVYTVGIGTEGAVMSPSARNPDGSYQFQYQEMSFDTRLLQEMADSTNGKFYRAFSENDLAGIYREIDRLEKTRVEVTTVKHTTEYFGWFITAAVVLMLLELLLRHWLLRSITE